MVCQFHPPAEAVVSRRIGVLAPLHKPRSPLNFWVVPFGIRCGKRRCAHSAGLVAVRQLRQWDGRLLSRKGAICRKQKDAPLPVYGLECAGFSHCGISGTDFGSLYWRVYLQWSL
jgi:hypothetical protein